MDTKVQGRFSFAIDIKSEVPIKELKSESHPDDFVVVNHQPDYAQAAMELVEGDLSRDIVMSVQMKRPRTGLDVVTSHPKGENGYFMLTLTPGDDFSSTMEPMDYVFLLDISGSMARDDKLAISRSSVTAFIDSLGPEDRFECLAFNLAPTPLFKGMRSAGKANLEEAKTFFSQQRARGGTVLQPALSAAYGYRDDDRPLNVVLLSDGMTDTGEQAELLRLIQSRPDGVRVFCIGVGNEVNRPLLEQMAGQAGGLAAFVSTQDSFQRQAHLMRQKLIRPAIENVSIDFTGKKVEEVEPQQLGDLFYGTPLRMFGRYSSGGEVNVTLRGQVQGGPWKQTVQLRFPDTDAGNSEIERMWAHKRISRLLGMERSGSASYRSEIVRLSEGYSIVSPYASMLVLENDAEYKRWKIEQRNANRIERDRRSRESVQQKLTQLRRQAENGFEVDRAKRLTTTTSDRSAATPNGTPDANPNASPSPGTNSARNADRAPAPTASRPGRGIDLDFGGGGGGGAIEPITAFLSLSTLGAAAMAKRRRRKRDDMS